MITVVSLQQTNCTQLHYSMIFHQHKLLIRTGSKYRSRHCSIETYTPSLYPPHTHLTVSHKNHTKVTITRSTSNEFNTATQMFVMSRKTAELNKKGNLFCLFTFNYDYLSNTMQASSEIVSASHWALPSGMLGRAQIDSQIDNAPFSSISLLNDHRQEGWDAGGRGENDTTEGPFMVYRGFKSTRIIAGK